MFDDIHHVAFAVRDMPDAQTYFEEVFGLELATMREVRREFNVEVAMYFAGDALLEILAPLNSESYLYDVFAETGEGFFHIAYEVDDIRTRMAELEANGFTFDDRDPRPGPDNAWEVATIQEDPIVMTQIVEQAEPLRTALGVE